MSTDPSVTQRPPWHLWAIGALALVWYVAGALAFVAATVHSDPFPSWWKHAIWGIGVGSGLAASLLLLLKRRLALPVFVVTFVCAFISMAIAFNDAGAATPPEVVVGVVIIAIPLGLAAYAWRLRTRRLLH